MIRVAVVDDHPLVSEGLSAVITREEDMALVVVLSSFEEATAYLHSQPSVDVMIIDIRLGDETGFGLLPAIHDLVNPPSVLFLSSFDLPQYVEAALRAGGSGFLVKSGPTQLLMDAVRHVARGGLVFGDGLRHRYDGPERKPFTGREREIVRCVTAGMTNDEIGSQLNVSRKTIEATLSKLYQRTKVASRVELAVRAQREGWLDDAERDP